ncbi:unnamed protein product [Phaedon cochleariae]|uniref:Double jelly roll-like domain-containing protein n=1 Tax=Phaedon cochleariae TaxID=80249 RepID=A0A9N9SB61_PHACE|nr:unnamed protein product [Phaedon cochleariae]
MVAHTTSEKLKGSDEPILDHSLISLHKHTYKPNGSPYHKNLDKIRIPINFQDLIQDIAESFIYIEGKFTPTDPTTKFVIHQIMHCYEMEGEQVDVIRNPGITTTMKTMKSYGQTHMTSLQTTRWGLKQASQDVLDYHSHIFSGKLLLKYLMGFAEDYTEGILNVKQELILIIAHTFKNSYIEEVNADLEMSRIEWKIKHIIPEDRQKLKLLNRINRNNTAKVKLAHRIWDLYELSSLRDTVSYIWAMKTTNSLERSRYIIIGFQHTYDLNDRSNDVTKFNHADVYNIRLYLNSEVYLYGRWNLDCDKKLHSPAYYAYEQFQRNYYNKDMSEPMMTIEEFRDNPLFIIDCCHQPDAMKTSTVDIKVKFETRKTKFPENTRVYA